MIFEYVMGALIIIVAFVVGSLFNSEE